MALEGLILYDGPSVLDGKPIIVVATGIKRKSENPKTGVMIQTWIMRKDIHPTEAVHNGSDKSICGNCKHKEWKTCYVVTGLGPMQAYKAFHKGNYKKASAKDIRTYFSLRPTRLGAYGDPAAVPTKLWEKICLVTPNWTGYTHQWRTCDQELRQFCMASCDTEDEAKKAITMGWRTFRVYYGENAPLMKREFICPASEDGGKSTTCSRCMACRGGIDNGKRGLPVIRVHGQNFKVQRAIEHLAAETLVQMGE